jgi:FKBP-type peptidyl-prolyl cis-trans isomerase
VKRAGDGVTFPKKGDKLEMHYTGKLAANGKKFDSSLDRGTPFAFKIGRGDVM